jgi:2-polyprenyl-6-methoxyphenol hydroxylase-like FAD-dependent oxidoreductase
MTERHPAITRRTYYLGGPMKVGMNPVARDRMYMFLLEPRAEIIRYRDTELHERLAELMSSYGGVVGELREALTAQSNIVVRPLETIFCPQPWHKDGVVLIGDAAHATTPQLASGAGMAMEDGVVLGECIAQADSVDGALDTFMKRRFERCALVVEKSLALGRLEKSGSAPVDQIRVVEAALQQLNKPY